MPRRLQNERTLQGTQLAGGLHPYGQKPSVAVNPGKDMVDPFERTAEPTVCTDRLSAKTENEITKLVLLERQADVHEIHVPAALGVSMFHCRPYRNGVGALPVQLALGCKIPQITIIAGVHTDTSSGDFSLITGDEQAARALPYEFDK